MAGVWFQSLQTDTPQADLELAVKLSRMAAANNWWRWICAFPTMT